MAKTAIEYDAVKSIADNIDAESKKIKAILNKCDSIIDENIGVPSRWTGQRANDVKNNFKKVSQDFNNYVKQIDSYVNHINEAYTEFKKIDE